jgi:glutamyl-tRNA synthetase
LEYVTPAYFHTALLADANDVRLAKRHDALALRTLRERGHSPEEVRAMFAANMTSVTSLR